MPRRPRRVSPGAVPAALALLAALAPAAAGAWPHDPYLGAVPVCTATGNQINPRACSDGASGTIVVWTDLRTGTADIYAQRFDRAGQPLWAANGVPVCTSPFEQAGPEIVPDGAGGVVVTWQDLRNGATYDVYAQRLDATGAPAWTVNGVPLCSAAGHQQLPQIVGDGAGGAVVAWIDERAGSSNDDVYAQAVSAAGTPQWTANGVALCTAASVQDRPRAVSDGLGGAIVTWMDFRSGTEYDLYAQRVNGGAAQWTANGVVVSTATGNQFLPTIASDGQGGAIVAWQDPRLGAANNDIYAQRINSNGIALWLSTGVQLSNATVHDVEPYTASDGSGGAFVAWSTQRAGTGWDVVVNRVTASGSRPWGTSGITIADATLDQFVRDVVPDGSGGALVAFDDARGGVSLDVYAARVRSDGVLAWEDFSHTDGRFVSLANGAQQEPRLVADGRGGAVVVWRDNRNGAASDVYAQLVDLNGTLGDSGPVIESVVDVPNDQGGRVVLTWQASWLDLQQEMPYSEYRIWRSVPAGAPAARAAAAMRAGAGPATPGGFAAQDASAAAYGWEQIDNLTAASLPRYSRVVEVPRDSMADSNPRTAFMVELHRYGYNPTWSWPSEPDSGYSVDNLAPLAPSPFMGTYAAGITRLYWAPNREADFARYEVHRGARTDFVPGGPTLIATQSDTGYVDAAGAPFVYKLVALDVHGNRSAPATFVPAASVDVPAATPVAPAFAPIAPNPCRGTARLRFSLPHEVRATLEVFDASGRRVRRLHDGVLGAGEQDVAFPLVDDAGRALPGGLYLVRLSAGNVALTRRVFAVR